MTGIENMDFGLRHIPPVRFRLGKLEREIMLTPDHQQPRLLLTHPRLPSGVGLDVGSIVVEEVTLNVCLRGLIEKSKFIGPEIRVVSFDVGIVSDMPRPRRREREEICTKRAFVRGAIGPEGPPRLPIRPQAFVVCDSVLDDERFDSLRMGQGQAKPPGPP